jgi:hypothetical protein
MPAIARSRAGRRCAGIDGKRYDISKATPRVLYTQIEGSEVVEEELEQMLHRFAAYPTYILHYRYATCGGVGAVAVRWSRLVAPRQAAI